MNEIEPSVIRGEARDVLRSRWFFSASVTFCFMAAFFVSMLLQLIHPALYFIAVYGVCLPLSVGLQYLFLDMARGQEVRVSDLSEPFKNYLRVLGLSVLTGLVVSLGMILLVFPGIILGLGLSMSYYILRDRPELSLLDTMKASWKMMDGHKLEYFLLSLSFIGWIILAMFTLIGSFWVVPYICTANGCFYERIRSENVL